MAVVYHWKHGWIPLDHVAALSKAKGNHAAAAKMLEDAHGSRGITSRQDVAKAALDLPNVPHADRADAHAQLHAGAQQHGGTDLVPSAPLRSVGGSKRTSAELSAAAEAKHAEAQRIADGVGWGDRAAGRLSPAGLKQAHRNTDSSLRRYTEAKQEANALEHKAGLQAAREREAARQHFTPEELKGATLIQTSTGWHEVVRVNGKTVTVKTPYSWTDAVKHEKILKVAHPGSEPGKSRVSTPQGLRERDAIDAPDSNPRQKGPDATSRPAKVSDREMAAAQEHAAATTALTMSTITDENLKANIRRYQRTSPNSPTLGILLAEARRRGMRV